MIKYSDGSKISVGDSVFIKDKAGCVLRVTNKYIIIYTPSEKGVSVTYIYPNSDKYGVAQLTKSDMEWGNIPSQALKMAYDRHI